MVSLAAVVAAPRSKGYVSTHLSHRKAESKAADKSVRATRGLTCFTLIVLR